MNLEKFSTLIIDQSVSSRIHLWSFTALYQLLTAECIREIAEVITLKRIPIDIQTDSDGKYYHLDILGAIAMSRDE